MKKERLDSYGRSLLHHAASDGNLSSVVDLVAGGADVNLRDKEGWGPLHFAVQAGAVDVLLHLVANGAVVDLQDRFGNTPLARATFNSRGDGTVIQALRRAGADPLKQNHSGVSPLSLARSIANYNVAQFYSDIAGV
jgi:uncharacterized protein